MSLISKRVVIDAISATVQAETDVVLRCLNRRLGTRHVQARPLPGRGYDLAAALVERGQERPAGLVMFGPRHPYPHVYAVGTEHYDSPAVFDALRADFPGQLSPSRIDVALDFEEPEMFERLVELLKVEALRRGLTLNHQGDWIRSKARTLYVGSRNSELVLRLYEYRDHHGHGPAVRLELEVKAKKAHRRAQVAALEPLELFGLSPVCRAVFDQLGIDPGKFTLYGGPRAPASIERDTSFLANTAWPALSRVIAAHLGDIEAAVLAVMARREQRDLVKIQARQIRPCDRSSDLSHSVTP